MPLARVWGGSGGSAPRKFRKISIVLFASETISENHLPLITQAKNTIFQKSVSKNPAISHGPPQRYPIPWDLCRHLSNDEGTLLRLEGILLGFERTTTIDFIPNFANYLGEVIFPTISFFYCSDNFKGRVIKNQKYFE